MIKVENIGVYNIENALRGSRNPLESWDKSDSYYKDGEFIIGEKDMKLAKDLIIAGSDHRKFMRQIFVSMDITTSMSVWWDIDTYKISTTRNSTSRMHKLGSRLLTSEDFSWDDESGVVKVTPLRLYTLNDLNDRIELFQRLKKTDKKAAMLLWREIILDLPDSYNFMSTWTGNFENLRNIYFARRYHKQRELREFCSIIEQLPYSELITVEG